jgi:uncharacterized membrane protein YfcA
VEDPTLTVLVLLGLAAVAAGFVDAVVGGGGLIQLPGPAHLRTDDGAGVRGLILRRPGGQPHPAGGVRADRAGGALIVVGAYVLLKPSLGEATALRYAGGQHALFVPQGAVLWKVGLIMGACNLAGGYVGARVAVSRGAGFVRIFFILVVSAFIVRIGGNVLGLW